MRTPLRSLPAARPAQSRGRPANATSISWQTRASSSSRARRSDAFRASAVPMRTGGFGVGTADLGDNDNYEHLCISRGATPIRVRAEPGVVLDPRGDATVETTVDVSR